jgi:3-oxoacyl-[acyl-carrier-protein] synthase II
VITGLGVVSPIGIGCDAVWDSIRSGQSGVRRIPVLEAADWLAPFGGAVENFDPKEFIQPRKSLKFMSAEIQFACAAATMAWNDAGFVDGALDPERLGVACGAPGQMFCDLEELQASYQVWLADPEFDIRRWTRPAISALFPLWMLKYLPNMPGCHVGIRYDARGPNNTISLGDVSSLLAIAEAADVIRRGAADVMLAGGTSSNLNLTRMMWHRGAGVATGGDGDPATVCRPFDAGRSGIVYGEGSAVMVLESAEHAAARGARPMARIIASASRYEAAALSQQPSGSAIRSTLQALLHQANWEPADIGHVNAHGNSSPEGDAAEAEAIRQVLGDVPVTAPKSFFGNLGPGSGAVELAMSLIGLSHGVVPPTLNYESPDPACPVNVVREMAPAEKATFVALNYNPSGQAAGIVVSR